MSTANKEITSLEIRNLLLETLIYEEGDIDTEGKTFKRYGYQGGQGDLYRLAEGLAIKRGLISMVIPLTSSAWGCSMYSLYEFHSTNFSKRDILKLFEEFSFLLNQEILSPGAYGGYGANLPYFHVTDYGRECLEKRDILPHDADGYLKKINTITGIDEWVTFYIQESLQCFNANCLQASIIMLGLAGEVIINSMIVSFLKFLDKHLPSVKASIDTELCNVWQVSKKYSIYDTYLKKCKRQYNDSGFLTLFSKMDSLASQVYSNFLRITRNELSHPSDLKMDRIEVLMIFVSFIKYCEIQYEFINHYKSNS